MCGFAGIFTGQSLRADTLRERVGDMAATVAHRGPDDAGVWVDESRGVALGFRRLAIIDLSEHGHQPMRSAGGRYTLVFNGEVYNHAELQRELADAGCRFRGHSDTEVVLAAFERWGVRRALDRFVGMFAMGIWDERERALTLVRDRLGIKPLYVHSADGTVLFGSELKALAAYPGFDRSLDPVALASYFRQLCVPAPLSIFAKTRKLPAGTLLTIRDPSAPLPEPEVFWSAAEAARHGAEDPFGGDDEEAVDELERLLRRAVALRMRSDVPIGALLSGGIDSSVVTALMRESSPLPVRTFCIGFDGDARHDESTHAAAVAGHLGTDHTELRLTGPDALAAVPRIAGIFDEPFADPSQIPSLLVCELARRHVTVALAGDGGDELFAGYNRYTYGNRAISWAGRSPALLRRAAAWPLRTLSADRLERFGGTVQRVLPRRLQERLVGEKLGKLGALLGQEGAPHMYRSLVSAWSDADSPVPPGSGRFDAVDYAFDRSGLAGTLPKMLLADQLGYLPDDLLAKVDRVSMAVSLEVRVPLIDHNVVEFSWRLPKDAKIRGGRGKWVLRQVLHRHVPRALVERPKMGFSVPLAHWLRGPLRPWAEDLLSAERLRGAGLLDVPRVRRSWDRFLAGDSHLALRLWTVLMFEAWRDRWAHAPAS